MRAGSRVSMRFVAMMTFTSPLESNPSSWFSSSSIVRWISLSPPELESYLREAARGHEDPARLSPPVCLHPEPKLNTTVSCGHFHAWNCIIFIQSPRVSSARAETHLHHCLQSPKGARLRAGAHGTAVDGLNPLTGSCCLCTGGRSPRHPWGVAQGDRGKPARSLSRACPQFSFSEQSGTIYPLMTQKREEKVYLFVPIASISSIKTMDGACSSATRNSSRTSLGPSPRYFWISSEPTTRRKVAEVWFATALANKVLPILDWKKGKKTLSAVLTLRIGGSLYEKHVLKADKEILKNLKYLFWLFLTVFLNSSW